MNERQRRKAIKGYLLDGRQLTWRQENDKKLRDSLLNAIVVWGAGGNKIIVDRRSMHAGAQRVAKAMAQLSSAINIYLKPAAKAFKTASERAVDVYENAMRDKIFTAFRIPREMLKND